MSRRLRLYRRRPEPFWRGLRFLRSRLSGRGLILLYHRVAERDLDPFGQCLSPAHFAAQMSWLASWANVLPMERLLDACQGKPLPPRAVAITFDDGYADNLHQALPILQRNQLPATIFVATAHPGEPFWWDRLSTILLRPARLPPALPPTLAQLAGKPGDLTRPGLLRRLHLALRPLDPREQELHLQQLARWTGAAAGGEPADRALTVAELVELAADQLVEIGAHTRDHLALAAHSIARQRQSIAGGYEDLLAMLPEPIRFFSYPYGLPRLHYDERTVRLVAEQGFSAACCVTMDLLGPGVDLLQLPRLWVRDGSLARFQRTIRRWLGE